MVTRVDNETLAGPTPVFTGVGLGGAVDANEEKRARVTAELKRVAHQRGEGEVVVAKPPVYLHHPADGTDPFRGFDVVEP